MNDKTHSTSQYLDNISYDEGLDIHARLPVEYDGNTLRRSQSKLVAEVKKIIVNGTVTTIYHAIAPTGTDKATAKWQVYKKVIDASVTNETDITKTWADGNAGFDNIATDLTELTYS